MINKTILIDIDYRDNIPGFVSKDSSVMLSGKLFGFISQSEKSQLIYKQIQENCDVDFLLREELDKIEFYPVPAVFIFARDSKGNYFGTLGGIGDIESKEYPVVYINKMSLRHGKIAANLSEFLSLVNFYPSWRSIIESEEQSALASLRPEVNVLQEDEKYLIVQNEIGNALNLTYDPNAIDLLLNRLRSDPCFIVYESKHEAAKCNKMLSIEEFVGIDL